MKTVTIQTSYDIDTINDLDIQSQEGGPSINEDEIDDYINEILN